MDVLIRQLWMKYPSGGKEDREGKGFPAREQQLAPVRTQSFKGSGIEQEGSGSTTRDQSLPPQKTQSFKGGTPLTVEPEKRRSQSWLRRQFSRQMSQDNDSSIGGEYQIAVAAAAFAVKSLEEARTRDEKKERHGPETSVTKIKNKEDDTASVPEPQPKSIKFSDEVSKPDPDTQDRKVLVSSETSKKPEKTGGLVPALKKKVSFADATSSSPPESALPEEKTVEPLLPSIRKAPLFANQSLDRTPSRKPENTQSKPDVPPLQQPQIQPADTLRQISTKPGVEDSKADAWEKAELARIKKKYEKSKTKILEWENKKKKKAKRKLERAEAEPDKRRAKALQNYRTEVATIDGIVAGARSQATENRRNEEFKVKEKANKIKSTGKLPATCLCC